MSDKPTTHTYDITLRIRSTRPYTRIELERLASWWVFVKDRQVTVESATLLTKGGKTRCQT